MDDQVCFICYELIDECICRLCEECGELEDLCICDLLEEVL